MACIVMQGRGYGGVQAEEGKSKRAGRGVQRSARTETGCSTVWVGKRESVVHLPLCEAERGERPLRGAVRTGAASIRCLASAPQAQLSQSKAAWPVTVSRCGHGARWTGVVCQAVVPDAPTNVGGLLPVGDRSVGRGGGGLQALNTLSLPYRIIPTCEHVENTVYRSGYRPLPISCTDRIYRSVNLIPGGSRNAFEGGYLLTITLY